MQAVRGNQGAGNGKRGIPRWPNCCGKCGNIRYQQTLLRLTVFTVSPRKCPPPPIKVTTDLPHTLSTSPYPFYVTIPKRLKVEVSRQKATIPHLDGFSLFFSVCPPDLIDECSVGCVKCGGGGGGGPRSNPNRISIYVH